MPTPPPPSPNDFRGRDLVAYLHALRDWLARNAPRVAPGSGLHLEETPGGALLSLENRQIGWIKVTARSGTAHAWTRVVATAGGGWSDDSTLAGTTTDDPSYEINADTTATLPYYAWAWRDHEQGEVRHIRAKC